MADEPTEANPYEQRSRAVKSYKLARVAVAALRVQDPPLPISLLEDATPRQRARFAQVAKVRAPSDTTWAVVIGLVEQMLRDGTGPFPPTQ